MKYKKPKFQEFLAENGISEYFLSKAIKKRITDLRSQISVYEATISDNEFIQRFASQLDQTDLDLLQEIKQYLIQRIRNKASSDAEILWALKKMKWTRRITESELKAMGMQASLSWNTTILGKLKLVRVGEYSDEYYLFPIAKDVKAKTIVANKIASKRKKILQVV